MTTHSSLNIRRANMCDTVNSFVTQNNMEPMKNIKKRRLLQAFQDEQVKAESVPKKNKIDLLALIEKKMKILENWEDTKRKALEKLLQEMDSLNSKEREIEEKEKLLETKGYTSEFIESAVNKNFDTPPSSVDSGRDTSECRTPSPVTIGGYQSDVVQIGSNGTTIPIEVFNSIDWSHPAAATRKVLMSVFDRPTLAFHTLTGKPSPAFMDCDKPLKNKLDPLKVADIIEVVTLHASVTPKDVRSAITTKCADENKMFRQREKKKSKGKGKDRDWS